MKIYPYLYIQNTRHLDPLKNIIREEMYNVFFSKKIDWEDMYQQNFSDCFEQMVKINDVLLENISDNNKILKINSIVSDYLLLKTK
jgi:hypothetical protein